MIMCCRDDSSHELEDDDGEELVADARKRRKPSGNSRCFLDIVFDALLMSSLSVRHDIVSSVCRDCVVGAYVCAQAMLKQLHHPLGALLQFTVAVTACRGVFAAACVVCDCFVCGAGSF